MAELEIRSPASVPAPHDGDAPVSKSHLDTQLTGKTDVGHQHSAGSITSGTLSVDQIPLGSTSVTVAPGNHTHSGYAATSHTHDYAASAHTHSGYAPLDGDSRVPTANMPLVPTQHGVTSGAATTLTFDAALGANIRSTSITGSTGSTTIAVPSGTPAIGQVIRGRVHAATASQNVSFASGIRTSTGLTRGPHSVPSGQVIIFTLEYLGPHVTAWALTSYTITAT